MSANDAVISAAPIGASSGGAVNLSLIKVSTIVHTIVGVVITGVVISATAVTVALVVTRSGFEPPIANPDVAANYKTIPFNVYPLLNDVDPKGNNLTLTYVSPAQHGTVTIIDGSYFQYQSNPYWSGVEILNYTCINDKLSATALITISILDHAPDVIDQAYFISKNSQKNVLSLFSYTNAAGGKISDIDNDIMAIYNVSSPANGNVTFDSTNVYYTPNTNFNGAETFYYCVTDFNLTSCANITVSVTNTAPVARQDYYSIRKNTYGFFSVMDNDYDPNGDAISIASVGICARGTASINFSDRTQVQYTPVRSSEVYTDSFEYSITDGSLFGYSSVVVDVTNTPPVAGTSNYTLHKNTFSIPLTFPYSDSDISDELKVTISTPPNQGAYNLTVSSQTVFVDLFDEPYKKQVNTYVLYYTPLYNYVYTDQVKYSVTDGYDTSVGTVYLNVINDPPVANPDYYTIHKNIPTALSPLANDTDPNGDSIVFSSNAAVTTNQGGSYTINADGTINYSPKHDFVGLDSVTYSINDVQVLASNSLSSSALITFNVVNDPPTPKDDYYVIGKGLSATFDVLANDTDPNGDTLTITDAGSPDSKATSVLTNGKIVYTAIGQVYSEVYKYTVSDPNGATAQALIHVTILNTPPVAVDDVAYTTWNKSVVINVLANDTDVNPGDAAGLTVYALTTTTTPQGGSISIVSGVSVLYTPKKGFVGDDSFQYFAFDGQDKSLSPATVTVHVTNNAPIANPSSISLHWGTSTTINVYSIAGNGDPDNDPIVLASASGAAHGSVSTPQDGVILYKPTGQYVGSDSISYTLSDWSKTATSTISVSVTNTPPVAPPVSLNVHWSSGPVNAYINKVVSDADNDVLSLTAFTEPTPFYGNISLYTPNNLDLVYTPTNWKGVLNVPYTISDGPSTASNVLTITITNLNVPTAANLEFVEHWSTQSVGTTFKILSSAGTKDADGDTLTLSVNSTPTNGNAVLISGSYINYKQSNNFLGNDTFTYKVSDGLDSATGTVKFMIYDNAPTASNYATTQHWTFVKNGYTLNTVSACQANDVDSAFGDVATMSSYSTTGTGSIVSNAANQITYTAAAGSTGAQPISVTFTDGLLTTSAAITITVQNALPTATPTIRNVHWATTSTVFDLSGDLFDTDSLDTVSLSSVVSCTNCVASIVSGRLSFSQTSKFIGNATVVLKFTDGWQSNQATWTVVVYDNPPVVPDQTYSVKWSSSVSGNTLNVLTGASDVDSADSVSLVKVSTPPAHGTTTVNGNLVLYYPTSPFVGNDRFVITATDGLLTTTAKINVVVTDTPPVAVNDAYSVHWNNQGLSCPVLSNDWDADNDTVSLFAITSQLGSNFAINSTKQVIQFTGSTVGVVTATYINTDGALTSNNATVTVTVTNANKPSLSSDSNTVHWRTQFVGTIFTPNSAARDADGDVLTLSLNAPLSSYATLTSDSIPKIKYQRANWTGTDSFGVKLTDGQATATAVDTITVYNNAPTASDVPNQFIDWTYFTSGVDYDLITLGNANDVDAPDVPYLYLSACTNAIKFKTNVTLNSDGRSVHVQPDINFNGTDSFTFTVSDGLSTVTRTMVISASSNVASPSSRFYKIHWSTYKAGSNFDVLKGLYTQGDTKQYSIVNIKTPPAVGNSASLLPSANTINNTLFYQQNISYVAQDTLVLSVFNSLTSADMTVTVLVYDNPPVLNSQSASVHWSVSSTVNLLQGASDPDTQDTVSIASVGSPVNGTITSSSSSGQYMVTYSGKNGFVGTEVINFVGTDGLRQVARTATFTLTNNPPVTTSKTYTILWRDFVAGKTFTVTTGDSDQDAQDTISLVSVTQPDVNGAGTVSIVSNSAGTVTLQGPSSFIGTFHFTYTITDGAQNGQVTQSVTVVVYDNAPTAVNANNVIHWRQSNVAKDVLSACSDQDGDNTTLVSATSSVTGTVVSVSGNNIIYTPKNKFIGTDVVSYTITDSVYTATATLTVTVTDQQPTAKSYSVTKLWSAAIKGTSFTVGADATDADTLDQPYLTTTTPLPTSSAGNVTYSGTTTSQTMSFVPSNGFVGPIPTISYTITDGLLNSAVATIDVNVTDNAPVITPQTYTIFWRSQFNGTVFNLTSAVSDADGDVVTLSAQQTSNSASSINGYLLSYKQNAGFLGSDKFTVSGTDGWLQATPVTFVVNVLDTAPVAQPISTSMHVSLPSVTINFNSTNQPSDVDTGDQGLLSFNGFSGSYDGSVSVVSSASLYMGAFKYTKGSNTLGTRTITYSVTDGLLSATNTLSVNVYDNAPTNTDYSATVQWRNCVNNGITINVGANAADVDPQDAGKLTFSVSSGATFGTVTQPSTGSFLYKCNSAARFTDSFQFTTTDGYLSTVNKVTVVVTNNAPVAQPDTYVLHWKLATSTLNVLANDTDADQDPTTINNNYPSTTSNNAKLTTVTGGFLYNLTSIVQSLNIPDVFSYSVTDSVDSSNSVSVSVTVYDNAPVVQPYSATIKWTGSVSNVNLGALISDADTQDTPSFVSISSPLAGSLVVNNAQSGIVSYTPSQSAPSTTSYSIPYVMTFTGTDGLLSTSNSFTVTVTNNAPTVTSQSATVTRNYNAPTNSFTGVRPSATDVDGDSLSVSNLQLSPSDSSSSISWSANSNSFSLTVPALFTGVKTLTWSLYDGQLYSNVSTFTITYVNNAPTGQPVSFTTNKATANTINNIASNCADANNDPLSFTLSGTAPFGTAKMTSAGVLTYTSSGARSGTINLNYAVSDSITSTSYPVTVTVVNRAPNANDVSYSFSQSYIDNYKYNISTYLKDSSASDPDSTDTVSIASVNINNCPGSVSVSSGSIIFVPGSSSYSGSCSLIVTVTDNDQDNPLTDTANMSITLTPRALPVANDDFTTADQGAGSITITTSFMLQNDVSPSSTSIAFYGLVPCATSGAGYCHRTPAYNPSNNAVTLEVDPMNCIADKFQYLIQTTDPSKTQANATVTVTFTNCYCRSPVDIYLILDNSGSIGSSNWEVLRAFTLNITNKLAISSSQVNVGIVDFGNYGNMILSLSSSTSAVTSALKNMGYRGEGTNTKSGLYAAVADITGVHPNNQSVKGAARGRNNIPKVLLVITDGYPNIPFKATPRSDPFNYRQNTAAYPDCQTFYNDPSPNPVNCTQGDFAVQSGISPSQCWFTNNTGLPCSDPTGYTDQINSWRTAQTSAYSQFPSWKVITMGIGDAVNNAFGQQMLAQMNIDKNINDLIMVGWNTLTPAVSRLTDAACNSS